MVGLNLQLFRTSIRPRHPLGEWVLFHHSLPKAIKVGCQVGDMNIATPVPKNSRNWKDALAYLIVGCPEIDADFQRCGR